MQLDCIKCLMLRFEQLLTVNQTESVESTYAIKRK